MFTAIKFLRKFWGHDKDSAETFDRLVTSKHVEDLRWIVRVSTTAAVVAIFLIFCMPVTSSDPVGLTPIGAVLATLGAIIAWCYQTGSGRLGIVDLFACEITTVCRICTIIGLADSCVGSFELDTRSDPPPDHDKIIKMRESFSHFESTEAYTPVFDANAKDLQLLSVKVVTNITAFYAYWKATRDAFRRLDETVERRD